MKGIIRGFFTVSPDESGLRSLGILPAKPRGDDAENLGAETGE